MLKRVASPPVALVALGMLLLGGCGGKSTTVPAPPVAAANQGQQTPIGGAGTERPVAPEKNPPGDIPDNQVFVQFASLSGGYSLQVPEGWARATNGADVRFTDKLDGIQVTISKAVAAPVAATARSNEVAALERAGRAVQITKVQDVQLPGGQAVFVEYASNSDPDRVTGKQVRLENNAYLFFKDGRLATLTLWAPLGADNADQWQQIARSFRWR